MLEPYEGRVLDPACGSCGLFIQSAEFIEQHGGRARKISIYGQENNQATWRIGRMNLAIHALAGDIKLGDSLLNDQHPGLKADFVQKGVIARSGSMAWSRPTRYIFAPVPFIPHARGRLLTSLDQHDCTLRLPRFGAVRGGSLIAPSTRLFPRVSQEKCKRTTTVPAVRGADEGLSTAP